MDAFIKPFESALAPIFRGLPALPENGKKFLVKYWPYIALVFGILQLLAVLALWQLAHTVNVLTSYANQVSIQTGYGPVTPSLGLFYYLGLASLVLDAIILLMAFAPLRAHKKKGWDLLFLGSLLNLLYGIVIMFDSYYGSLNNLIGALVGSAIAFYLLFQVRDYYTGAKSTDGQSTSSSAKSKV